MKKFFKKILVVVKQTPYEQYLQLKAQGKGMFDEFSAMS